MWWGPSNTLNHLVIPAQEMGRTWREKKKEQVLKMAEIHQD